jgi:hypothetical protein
VPIKKLENEDISNNNKKRYINEIKNYKQKILAAVADKK